MTAKRKAAGTIEMKKKKKIQKILSNKTIIFYTFLF